MNIIYKIKHRINVLYRRVCYTCKNLTLHGPPYMVRKDIHIIYKVIYFVIYLQVWAGVIMTIRRYYNHYQENTIRFTTVTDYLHWNTTFPAITVCEILNVDKIWMLHQRSEVEKAKIDRFIGDVAFFAGTCFSCTSTCESGVDCPKDFRALAEYYRSPCEKLFISCKWNGKSINCCKNFRPIDTEFGICYSFNNRHVTEKEKLFTVTNKKRDFNVALELVVAQDYEAFLHSPDDVPFSNMEYDRRVTVLYGSHATMSFSITDIVNEPEVSGTAPYVRKCRFGEELPENFEAYNVYSYSTCISQCRINAQIKLCNCTQHLSPIKYKDKYCDLEGLKCLTSNHDLLKKLKVPDFNQTGLECECVPSCTEPDYNIVSNKIVEPQEDVTLGSAKFILSNRPYQRITRQVARTTLDLVVAMGNCFGLCFGGSLLSIVEIVYYLFFKKWSLSKYN